MWRFTAGVILGLAVGVSGVAVAEFDWQTRQFYIHPKDSYLGKQERFDKAYDQGQWDAANGITPYRHRQEPC